MLSRFKVDSLLIFLILSAGLVALSAPDLKSLLWIQQENYYANQLEIADALHSPIDKPLTYVEAKNPKYKLVYSLDGGDNYRKADFVDIACVDNPNILFERTSYRWRPSSKDFPKLNSVRIRIIDESARLRSDDQILTYIEQYQSELPIISLNTSQSGLFSYSEGIMTMGKFEGEQENFQQEWWWKNANYQQRGVEWERPANLQYFENGELLLDQNCGIRISGNASRCFPQKSLRVYSRRAYGEEFFTYPFWPDGISKTTSVVLRNSGNDNSKTLFADRFLHELSRDCKVLVQEGKAVNLFINGNYWGIYNLRERIDLQFVAEKKGCKMDEVTILEDGTGELKDGLETEKESFDSLMRWLPETLTDEDFSSLDDEVSLNSFTDYVILETFFGNEDWPANNSMWYKTEDKKWKFLINDLDYTLAYSSEANVNSNVFDKLNTSNAYVARLFRSLMSQEKFKAQFKNRANELFESTLSLDNITETFYRIKDDYQADMQMAIDRWRVISSVDEWESNCQKNLDFLTKRQEIYLKQVEDL